MDGLNEGRCRPMFGELRASVTQLNPLSAVPAAVRVVSDGTAANCGPGRSADWRAYEERKLCG